MSSQNEETDKIEIDTENPSERKKVGFFELFKVFSLLGWTAFGGPTAHFGQFHKIFVETKNWISEETFAELLALCQAVPGPASTQMSFAVGIFQKGVLGGLFTGILFQYPGVIIMSLAGFGAAEVLVNPAKWLEGLSAGLAAAAVALVAEAALGLGKKICSSFITLTLCVGSAFITFYYQSQWVFPLIIVVGGLVTIFWEKDKEIPPARDNIDKLGLPMWGGALTLLTWLIILIVSIIVKNQTDYEDAKFMHWFESFYLTGSVTYGGGQVVLPILENSVVKFNSSCRAITSSCVTRELNTTWVTEKQFLAGLGLAQAIPGPLFNFAAYLGAIFGDFPGIVAAWFGLFGPGILIIYGVLPFWGRFRKWKIYRRAMPGFNSSAVGLIFASVFTLGLKAYNASPFPTASVCIGFIGYWVSNFIEVCEKKCGVGMGVGTGVGMGFGIGVGVGMGLSVGGVGMGVDELMWILVMNE